MYSGASPKSRADFWKIWRRVKSRACFLHQASSRQKHGKRYVEQRDRKAAARRRRDHPLVELIGELDR
jgi:hypothetical protein